MLIYIRKIIETIKNDHFFIYASQASFYIIISSIPFISLFISLFNKVLSANGFDISYIIIKFLPDSTQSLVNEILYEITSSETVKLISFSVISLLWTSSRGISGIRRGIRVIYNIPSQSFIKDVLSSIILVFPVLLIFATIVFFAIMINSKLHGFAKLFTGIIFLSIVLNFIYFLLASKKLRIKYHYPGSLSSSVIWIIFLRIYSFYIENYSNYSSLYGSLTSLLLVALWIYFSIIIFFIGAEINKWMINKKRTV